MKVQLSIMFVKKTTSLGALFIMSRSDMNIRSSEIYIKAKLDFIFVGIMLEKAWPTKLLRRDPHRRDHLVTELLKSCCCPLSLKMDSR